MKEMWKTISLARNFGFFVFRICKNKMDDSDDDDVIMVEEEKGTKRRSEVIDVFDSDEEEVLGIVKIPKGNQDDGPIVIGDVSFNEHNEVDEAIESIKQHYSNKSIVAEASGDNRPFVNLRNILEDSTFLTDDFAITRLKIFASGTLKIIFECLSIYTHHSKDESPDPLTSPESLTSPEPSTSTGRGRGRRGRGGRGRGAVTKRWAKRTPAQGNGTGYGSGALAKSANWNAQAVLEKQQVEDQHISELLDVLASYINPGDDILQAEVYESAGLSLSFVEMLEESCLLSVLRNYMRNDSILDMSKHVTIYRSVLRVIRAISTSPQLLHSLMMTNDEDDETTLAGLISALNSSVSTYVRSLK